MLHNARMRIEGKSPSVCVVEIACFGGSSSLLTVIHGMCTVGSISKDHWEHEECFLFFVCNLHTIGVLHTTAACRVKARLSSRQQQTSIDLAMRVLQCDAVCCSAMQCAVACFHVLQHVAVCCSVLQFVAYPIESTSISSLLSIKCAVHEKMLMCHGIPAGRKSAMFLHGCTSFASSSVSLFSTT